MYPGSPTVAFHARQQRTLMGALITIDVHARDVVRFMVKSEICSVTDFEWTKQLRYYWEVRLCRAA